MRLSDSTGTFCVHWWQVKSVSLYLPAVKTPWPDSSSSADTPGQRWALKYPWNSSHVEQGCTDVLWKWKVWKGEQRVVPGNDSVGGKSKVSVLGMSQLSCLTSGGRSISVYCLQSCCYKFSIHMRHFIQEMFGQKYCKAICGKVMNWGVNNFRFFFIWKSNIHSTLDFPILC